MTTQRISFTVGDTDSPVEEIMKVPIEKKRIVKPKEKCCSVNGVKRFIPIIGWLPSYSLRLFAFDAVAGITVGLTAIPQGLAYAAVAGLPPEYGLYSALLGGIVYMFFGSCKDVTIGPTAIMSTLITKYVAAYSPEFAVLGSFLTGVIVVTLGLMRLGFVINFISAPVVTGFVTGAALQIISTQIKPLLGIEGNSGTTFLEACVNFMENYKTYRLWDAALGLGTIQVLLALKYLARYGKIDKESSIGSKIMASTCWGLNLLKNAIIVILGAVLAFALSFFMENEPFTLTGPVQGGIPPFALPPTSAVSGDTEYSFVDMLSVYGPQAIVVPLIAIIEVVAINKAFTKGSVIKGDSELVALGLCNLVGSLFGSMPITGSLSRSAINNASGVKTPTSGLFTSIVVLLALTLMTKVFYYIPKATLAGLIITAMIPLIEVHQLSIIYKAKKIEFFIATGTLQLCLLVGLEYGIVGGVLIDALRLLFNSATIPMDIYSLQLEDVDLIVVSPSGKLLYCGADKATTELQEAVASLPKSPSTLTAIIIDGSNVHSIDTTFAKNLSSMITNFEKKGHSVVLMNFNAAAQKITEIAAPNSRGKFRPDLHLEDYAKELALRNQPEEVTVSTVT